MSPFQRLLALLAGEDRETTRQEEILAARRELDSALDALRSARASWSSLHTVDVHAIRAALDAAERQLDAARIRLQRALTRRD